MAMDFGEMQTPFQKLSKMETEGNHRLGKGEMSRMWLSPLWKWNSERKRPHAKTRLVFVLWGHLCTASLQVILWLKMEFVLAPNLTSFALLLVHLPSCICHEFRRLADINPSWVCPPETWARPCESFSAATLLGCWDPSQALQRLQCLVPSQPACQPCRVRSPASLSGAAAALAAFAAPSDPGAHLAVHLCCAGGAVESSSARHLPCSAIHPLSSHWGLLECPVQKCNFFQLLNLHCVFVFSGFTFVLHFLFVGITLWNVSAKMARVFMFPPMYLY